MQNEIQVFCTSHTFVQYSVGRIVSYKDVYIFRDIFLCNHNIMTDRYDDYAITILDSILQDCNSFICHSLDNFICLP